MLVALEHVLSIEVVVRMVGVDESRVTVRVVVLVVQVDHPAAEPVHVVGHVHVVMVVVERPMLVGLPPGGVLMRI